MVQISRPTLLLDRKKCLANIDRIVSKANKSDVVLRPHFKTHQSHEIGRWFRDRGVEKCTVSSLHMAEYFAEDGWDDITVAFPVNHHEIEVINRLASKITLNILIASIESVPLIQSGLKHNVNAFLDIDTGYHRTGFAPDNVKEIDEAVQLIDRSPVMRFAGFLSHAGHTYKCRSQKEIKSIHQEEMEIMFGLENKYRSAFKDLIMSVGDTPSASVLDRFEGMTEIRPGNLVFYDLVQERIGSCTKDQIALAMACPVVAVYPERNEAIIYGGGVHFSKDSMTIDDRTSFGEVVEKTDKGWSTSSTGSYLKSLSQEHGIVHVPENNLKVGDVVLVLPVHACLTADAMGSYTTLEGEKVARLASPV
ncbi:MAG: alanine racemase [Cyclobacteriaceae bacterium]|nr:alanine racemase [Cyclobacteriaceae bacterium]